MGKKGAMPNFKLAEDYIDNQPKERQNSLRALIEIILQAVPEAIEIQNKKVPSYSLVAGAKPETQLMILASKKYLSFYPFEGTVEKFKKELKDYELGKGTVKLPYDKSLPSELIKRMVRFRKEELQNSLKK